MPDRSDANTEPVLARLVMTHARSNVVWPLHLLRTDDRIRISAVLPAATVVDVEHAHLPVLRKLTLHADIDGVSERVQLIVPADTKYTLISAIRTARLTCRVCHRTCLHPYDAADSTAPYFAICAECDDRITAEVRDQMRADAQTEEAVANAAPS